MMLAADAEWWWSIVAIVVGALVLSAITAGVAMILMARDVRNYMLPYFLPPKPNEVDVSLPARVSRLSEQLVNHMGAEETLRTDDIADRDRRQNEMDAWRDEVRDDIATIKDTQATKTDIRTVHRRIDTALARLAAGNPELRAGPPVTIQTPVEFDAYTASEWSQACAELDVSGEVTVDMAGTTFCDSTGIGAVLHLRQRTHVAGGTFRVVNVGPIAARTARMLHVGDVLGIEP